MITHIEAYFIWFACALQNTTFDNYIQSNIKLKMNNNLRNFTL